MPDKAEALHGDILERILGHVPLVYLLPALRVSRSWCHAVHSSLLHINPPKPWLLLHSLSLSATAYDPSSRIWLRLDRPDDLIIPTTRTLRSSGNMLYTISPSKFSFSLDPLHLTWHHLDGPLVWRADPIVALVGRRVIVAGGACDFVDDPLAVETYDLDAGTWSSCDSMPSVLRDCPASTWLSVAAVGDVMYVMEKATGGLHVYNARQMTWHGPIDLSITQEASWRVIGAMQGGLVVAAAVGGKGGSPKGVTVWKVDVETWRVSEVGEMPAEMSEKFRGGRSMMVCCSDQGFAYLYGGGAGSLDVAWCEVLGKGGCKWGWVEGGSPAGVMTCADVGLEELNRAMMGHGVLSVEESAPCRLFPPITVFNLIVRKNSPFPFTFWCCSGPESRLAAFQRGEATPTFERPRRGKQREGDDMTIKPAVRILDRDLVVKNHTILNGVPDNVIATSASSSGPVEGIFLGAEFDSTSSCHVVPLGTLSDVRFMACFRFKLWWMAQKMGDKGSEIPLETQFLLVKTKEGSLLEPVTDDAGDDDEDRVVYTIFLPLIEGPFRACLQGNMDDQLELCLESGDLNIKAKTFTHSVFIHAGTDPFKTIFDAVTAVKSHLKTFRQRHEKKLPGILDYFGWCTWDAFYQEVTQEGVEAGLESLACGGTPSKFVIIDDGWQSVERDPQDAIELDSSENKPQPLLRLTGIKENSKFQRKDGPAVGIKGIVNIAKEKYGLKYVYVWHAITGYWGGVRPGFKEMEEYDSEMKYPSLSRGVVENEPTWKSDVLAVQGLGLVNPRKVYKFYNELHSYLASAGIDGVKVDVQCILETLGSGLGGRVELTSKYHQALDASVARNFPDNGCIACMSHNTDALYCSKQTAVVRASDDFYPRDPASHTIHIAAVAYNSVFLGEFMQPDWDMFHSVHPAAEYHASARAISGGPVYVSDAPGKHNFDLLKKLVLPDGSVLRARLPGRPTHDCLFSDPARDGVSLLKIWNMNKYTGVLGIYNCQGAAWNRTERKNTFHQTKMESITGFIKGRDVHLIREASTDSSWAGDCAVYSHRSGDLVVLPHNAVMPISLKVLEHEIFTVTPIKTLAQGHSFAPFGLIGMYNAGGAIMELEYGTGPLEDESVGTVWMEVKGCGRFGAYSSVRPRKCTLGRDEIVFDYDSCSGLLSLNVDECGVEGRNHAILVEF